MKAGVVVGFCLAAAVAGACLRESFGLFAIAFGGNDGSRPVLSPRRMVARFVPRGERVTLLRNDSAESPSQVCRSIFLSIAWAAGAGNVDEKRVLDGCERYVVMAPTAFAPDVLSGNPRYREYGGPGTGSIWVREDAPLAVWEKAEGNVPRKARCAGIAAVARERWDWREALGLVVPAAVAVVLLVVGLVRFPGPAAWTACAAVLAANSLFALSHTFTGPCGTGVFGGRARALVESGWNLAALADPGMGEYFQAAYPPLQAVVTAAGYWIAGTCGEWLTQLGPVVFLAASFLVMEGMGRGQRTAVRTILLASSCVTDPMVAAAGNFCAEPLLLLLVASGWAVATRGNKRGWFLIGLAALVKNEGLIYVAAVAAAEAVAGRLTPGCLVDLALGLLPAAMWHLGCRWTGAALYDYALPWQVDPVRAAEAASSLFLEVARHPWRYAFVFLLPVTLVRSAARTAAAPAAFFAVFAAGICWAFSLSRAPDFTWHLSCMPRLLAPASALALATLSASAPGGQGRAALPDVSRAVVSA